MTDIIARLEAAEGGSRELDAEIARIVGARHGPLERVNYEDRAIEIHDEIAQYYTTSLDAALTLVPKEDGGNEASFISAVLWQRHIGDIPKERIALAICIAALKARLA